MTCDEVKDVAHRSMTATVSELSASFDHVRTCQACMDWMAAVWAKCQRSHSLERKEAIAAVAALRATEVRIARQVDPELKPSAPPRR